MDILKSLKEGFGYTIAYILNDCYINSNKTKMETHVSPNGKYRLEIGYYNTKPGCWQYSRGMIYKGDELIADVKRNYSRFPFCWLEDHPKGEYLVCGEDYQGYTVVNLKTSVKRSYIPKEAKYGVGFCWIDHIPSPDKLVMAVMGCVWAGPYNVRFYDFSNPDSVPFKELGYLDTSGGEWVDNNTFEGLIFQEVRKSDGVPINELPEEEWPDDACWTEEIEEKEILGSWRRE